MHPQRLIIETALLIEEELFDRKSRFPYYGTDMMGKGHEEHMKWRTFKPYADAFESELDSSGHHSKAHRAGMNAIEDFKSRRKDIRPWQMEPKKIIREH